MICINGPEGFLPKKQNFMMQVVQVLWYRPKGYLFVHPNLKISSASDMHPMLVCGLANLEVH